ncbi:hypothetical protein HII36_06545 [Nonomuraea sp. NN258]|uniref:hypothetical protein n=1 Tax=Nonomuraea antri TaxID=2730852 RepID=UPI00156893F0|nr:hypothetical protein [Nonomuraea antri]NRQ31500.1 hypothetical protein [Nonomuraea antri]
MEESAQYARYRRDGAVLAEIGRRLEPQVSRLPVRIPGDLAAAAVAAWERDEPGDLGDLRGETHEQRGVRDQAGALALIGLAITERGTAVDGDAVLVELDVTEIAAALTAALEAR